MQNKTIWIIGASAGIGRALAESLDQQGANLILSSRYIDELENLNNSLSTTHRLIPFDAGNNQQLQDSVNKIFESIDHIDIIIYMAAIYKNKDIGQYDYDFAKALIEVNLLGAINLAYKVIPKLINHTKNTQLIFCASIAGYIGLPTGQPYSCSKAAMINFAESLHAELADTNIKVRVINPGFVKTRLTDKNEFKMPCLISSQKAANYIIKDLYKSNFEIHFPKRFTRSIKLLRLLPYKILLSCTSNFKTKST